MRQAYIVDAIRTPVGNYGGSLSSVRADDLGAIVIRELITRNKTIDVNEIGDVIFGCANQAGEDNRNVARMSLLLAGLPFTIPGETVNRLCASGMSAVINAARMIQTDNAELMIAGGVESMSRAPYVMSKATTAFARDAQIFDTSIGWRFVNPKMREMYGVDAMGETAENLAELHKINRDDQDKFSVASHQKATASKNAGRFEKEIFPVSIPQKKGENTFVKDDEFIKPNTSIEILSKLKPAFRKDGTVTAGNSSGVNDGACAVLIASEDAIKKYNLKPLARIASSGVAGVEPRIMGIGPVPASNKALAKAGLKLSEINIIELNEAFAAQSLACIRSFGLADDDSRINPNGGAIALGHPLGMSGARLLQTASLQLQQTNSKYALCTMCIGVGQGYAVVLEKV